MSNLVAGLIYAAIFAAFVGFFMWLFGPHPGGGEWIGILRRRDDE